MRIFVFCSLLLCSLPAAAEIERNRFVHREWDVELTVPPDWILSENNPYPGILVAAIHRMGTAYMTLAMQSVDAATTARSYSQKTSVSLKSLGLNVLSWVAHHSGAYLLDTTTPGQRTYIRQAFYIQKNRMLILTLAAPVSQKQLFETAFNDMLRSYTARR